MPRARRTADIRLPVALKAAPDEVYRALTSARELCVWWLDRAETDARNMGRWRMEWPAAKGEKARGEASGVFVDLEPGRKVAWIQDDRSRPAGVPALVTFFIESKGRGCEVTLVHAGFSAAPGRAAVLASWRGGWEDCLAKLKLYLETGRAKKGEVLTLAAARR